MANDDWMIDNTGGEFTPKNEEESVGSQIVGALGRTLQALPDALAEQKPIIGRPLQALFNTDAYQARQAGYQMAKEKLADWKAGADLREQERKNALMKAQAAGEDFSQKRATDLAELKARENAANARSAAIPGQQALLQEKLDNQYYETVYNETENNGWKMFSDTGMLSGMSSTEIENIKKDNPLAFRVFWEKGVAVNLFQRALKGDKNAEGLLDRWCRKNGLRYVKGSDGVPMLMRKGGREDGEDAPVLELTPDGLREFYQSSQNPVVAELNARRMISDANAKGNPVLRAQQSYLRAIVPLCGGSYVQANNILKSLFDDMQKKDPIGYQSSFLVSNINQAIGDYGKGIPGAEQELLSCIRPTKTEPNGPLAALGFEITQQGDRPEDFEFKRREANGEYKQYSFDDVREYMKENDVLGKTLQARIGFLQEASHMSMMRNARSRQGMGRTTGKPSVPSATDAQEPQINIPAQEKEQAISFYGAKEFMKLSPEKKALLIQKQNEIGEAAIAKGALIRDSKTGKYVPDPKITPELLTQMQELENTLLGDVSTDLKGKGFWSRLNGIRKADRQIAQGKKMEKTGEDLTRRAVAPPEPGFWQRLGYTMGAKDRLALAGTGLSLVGRAKQESGTKDKKANEKALRRKK